MPSIVLNIPLIKRGVFHTIILISIFLQDIFLTESGVCYLISPLQSRISSSAAIKSASLKWQSMVSSIPSAKAPAAGASRKLSKRRICFFTLQQQWSYHNIFREKGIGDGENHHVRIKRISGEYKSGRNELIRREQNGTATQQAAYTRLRATG